MLYFILENMALHKSVQMSSVLNAYHASFCTDGEYGPGTNICHSQESVSNWIRVDLGSLKIVTFVLIHNRHIHSLDALQRLSFTDVYVFNNEDPNDNRRFCAHIGQTSALAYLARLLDATNHF